MLFSRTIQLKRGEHIIPDTLCRINQHCDCKDCSVEKFLQEIPAKSELMTANVVNNSIASITNMIWVHSERGTQAVTTGTVLASLKADIGNIPFGNKRVWKELQQEDLDCKAVI